MADTELRLHAKGFPLNRSARKQKLELLIDPSEDCFLSRAIAEESRIKVVLTWGQFPPIQLSGVPLGCRLKLRDVQLADPIQIGLLEFLINDEEPEPCTINVAYEPEAELPFDEPSVDVGRLYEIDADGFVMNPMEVEVIVPDFLKAEVKLLFAEIKGRWYYGYEIKGRVDRSRRVCQTLTRGWEGLAYCLHDLSTSIEEALHKDASRLSEFLVYKIDAAARAVEDRNAELAEAMAQEIHLPADFAGDPEEGSTAEDAEDAGGAKTQGPLTTASEPQVLTFKAKGVKQASVTIRLQEQGGRWRYGFDWQLGNFTDGEQLSASDGYYGKAFALRNLMQDVSTSIADIVVSGSADHRRSVDARRATLVDQFTDWIQEMIDAAESETSHESPVTGHDHAEVPFEEDAPRQQA